MRVKEEPKTGRAKTSARRGCSNLFCVDRAGFEPRRRHGPTEDMPQPERCSRDDPGQSHPHGAAQIRREIAPDERGPSSARRDLRPTDPGLAPTNWVVDPSAGPLQFRSDHLLEFHNVSREFADTFRQFLGSHRVLVQRETERFLVE